jgi:trk system potassium uptake protein TrkA
MYVIVVGGGKVGYFLSKKLLEEGYEVLIVEKDNRKVSFIREELGEIVFWGDGCEVSTMEEAGMKRADVVVAVTGDDEDNLVICQMAKKKFNVKRTIARVNNPKNEEIFKKLGIDETVNSTRILYSLIEEEVETGNVIPLLPLKKGEVEIIEIFLKEDSPVIGKKIKEIPLDECVIVGVVRDEKLILPTGGIELKVGDTVFAIVKSEKETSVREIFGRTQK